MPETHTSTPGFAGRSRLRLPTDLNPSLLIRDFGVGLSEEQISQVHARYGASTKRATDDQVGAFGLGCKSAFTLGQQFVVTAVRDGHRTGGAVRVGRGRGGRGDGLNRAVTGD